MLPSRMRAQPVEVSKESKLPDLVPGNESKEADYTFKVEGTVGGVEAVDVAHSVSQANESSQRLVLGCQRSPTRQRAQPNRGGKGKLAIHRRESAASACVRLVDGVSSHDGTAAPTGRES